MNNKFAVEELSHIETTTLDYYEMTADSFWESSKHHDVSQNYQAFLQAIEAKKPFKILDLGCGPGRDLKYFSEQGHQAIGIDGAKSFCQMAREYSKCEVWEQNFLNMILPPATFDGVFANAALFHIPQAELHRVLKDLNSCLKPGGILFASNPRNKNAVWYGEQPGSYLEIEDFDHHLQEAGFTILDHYFRPAGKPLHEQNWLAVVARKSHSLL